LPFGGAASAGRKQTDFSWIHNRTDDEITLDEAARGYFGNPKGTHQSRFSCGDVGTDDIYEVAGGFKGLLCFVMRNESCVVIESHIPPSTETAEDCEQASVLGVNSRPNEFDDCDVMAGLASCPEAVAEHKSQSSP
jgi:hypothetical protein